MLDRYSSLLESLLPSSCEIINSLAGHGDLGECFTVPIVGFSHPELSGKGCQAGGYNRGCRLFTCRDLAQRWENFSFFPLLSSEPLQCQSHRVVSHVWQLDEHCLPPLACQTWEGSGWCLKDCPKTWFFLGFTFLWWLGINNSEITAIFGTTL